MDKLKAKPEKLPSNDQTENVFSQRKRSSSKKRRLFQKVFSPNIKSKSYKKRSIKKTCEELVKSFYPETIVSYEAMRYKLICQYQRCSRPTLLAYLGRPETRQKETVDHLVTYNKSGKVTNKTHTFTHKLPKKKGYVEVFGLALLQNDFKTGKTVFRLFHNEQTKIDSSLTNPPHDSSAIDESLHVNDFSYALAYAKHQVSENSTLKKISLFNNICKENIKNTVSKCNEDKGGVRDREERDSIKKEKKFEIYGNNLSEKERRLFGVLDSSVNEAS